MSKTTNSIIKFRWLTQDYLERILRKYKNDESLKIKNFNIQPATGKGENYISDLMRISVEYSLHNKNQNEIGNYILKTQQDEDAFVADIMSDYNVINTEMLMYKKVCPQITALLREIGDDSKLFADTIHVDIENKAIILEDLKASNYIITNRLVGMDMEHVKFTLKQLAKIHAAAAVLNERKPGFLTKFDRSIFNRHVKGFTHYFEYMVDVCADFAGECKELGVYYKDKLLKLKPHLAEYVRRLHDIHDGHFHTLNHGDCWVNNIMVNYKNINGVGGAGAGGSEGKQVNNIVLLDLQFPSWTSPATDLHFFFNTSPEKDIRFYEQDALVQYYYEELTQTLREFNFRGFIPTLHQFYLQFEAARFYAVSSAIAPNAIMLNDKTENADFHSLLSDDERGRKFRAGSYTNPLVQEHMKILLPFFDRRGLLDIVD